VPSDRLIVNVVLGKVWKEVVMIIFKVLSQHSYEVIKG
jgi:hypothetical protein